MVTKEHNKQWHLIRNDNGEWISDDYAVFLTPLEATILRARAGQQGKELNIQHGADGLLWCYRHEYEAIIIEPTKKTVMRHELRVKKRIKEMNKEQICETLCARIENKNLKFPKQIDFCIYDSVLYLHIEGSAVRDNMQTDGSAFEGWLICIKSYLPEIKNVELNWDLPLYSANTQVRQRQEKHYNRFLLRVFFFSRHYNWFIIHKSKIDTIRLFSKYHSNLLINYPANKGAKEVSGKGKINKGEAKLERFVMNKMRESIPVTDHQLPVGLFDDEVKSKRTCTPRGASQIDLWQIDRDVLRIFELKDEANNEVGIISELMFYANVMNEVNKGRIKYPQSIETATDYRNIQYLYRSVKDEKINSIEAVFLVYKLHPLIESNLDTILDIINDGMVTDAISFKKMLVTDIIGK
jgi:hypothetical protein